MFPLDALLVGRIAPLGDGGAVSAIDKRPVTGPQILTRTGFAGDQQAGAVHGGPEKAVHHYPADHYPPWRAEIGDSPALRPGGFGENLSTTDLTERDIALGDTFRLGRAVVQVSQARQPCWKLNLRFGRADMSRRVQESGRTGWYYRVLEEGAVAPDAVLERIDRPAPDWTLERLWRILYVETLDRDELARMAELPLLTESWRRLARNRLARAAVEDWSPRLDG